MLEKVLYNRISITFPMGHFEIHQFAGGGLIRQALVQNLWKDVISRISIFKFDSLMLK